MQPLSTENSVPHLKVPAVSSGAIGRLVVDDVVGFVRYVNALE